MKVTLSFNLPKEKEDFEITLNATNYKIVIDEIDNILRSKLKYNSDNLKDNQFEIIEEIRNTLHSLIASYNINF